MMCADAKADAKAVHHIYAYHINYENYVFILLH